MKKILKYFGITLLSFLLLGCSSELDEQANIYASYAIEKLIEYADNDIVISAMDWICWESEFADDGIIYVCSYYIEYKNERSEIDRFVQVIISESTYYEDIQATLNTLSTKKELEDSFNSSLDYAIEADKESFGDTFRSLQFKDGSLSRREISDALKAAK